MYQNVVGAEVTIGASAHNTQVIIIPTFNGYTPIACGVRTTGTTKFYASECYVDYDSSGNAGVRLTLVNNTASSATGTPRVFVLYKKQ